MDYFSVHASIMTDRPGKWVRSLRRGNRLDRDRNLDRHPALRLDTYVLDQRRLERGNAGARFGRSGPRHGKSLEGQTGPENGSPASLSQHYDLERDAHRGERDEDG